MVDFFEEFVPSLNVLAKFAQQRTAQFFPEVDGTFSELSAMMPNDPVVQELKTGGLERAFSYIEKIKPDAIISTSPVAGGIVAEIKGDSDMIAATMIPDFGAHKTWLHPEVDIYFTASREAREDLVVRGVPWDSAIESGVPIHERFSETLDRKDCRAGFSLSDRFTVLLTSMVGAIGEIKELALKLAGAGVQVAVVTGRNERTKNSLKNLSDMNEMIKLYGFVEEMHRMMRATDVLVCKAGGLIVPEALAMRLPIIIRDPSLGQEIYNVDFLLNCGAGLLSRDEEDVMGKVRFLSTHPDRLAQMSADAGIIGKPMAAQTVCERVLAALGSPQ